eukprot:3217181-Pyramimonas_sp.AAC.1
MLLGRTRLRPHATRELNAHVEQVGRRLFYRQMQSKELKTNYSMASALRQQIEDDDLSRCYAMHTVAQSAPPDVPCIPCALYADGVPSSGADGACACDLANLTTQATQCLAAMRKGEACPRGCKG